MAVKYIASVFLLLAVTSKSFTKADIITSPPITDWGEWGFMQLCPNGTVVQGFQLKTEPYRGALVDDTALNAVRFYCGHPLNPNATQVTSSVGSWGNWGNIYSCGANGSIVGFQLRVEAFGIVDDETATNNVRFICSNMEEPNNYIEGDGLNFGSWREAVRCPDRQALCGIQTQIQPDRGALLDDTAMNNLSAECCPVPASIEYK